MEDKTKRNIKTAIKVTGLALGATYLVMRHIAKKQYPKSVYADKPEEQNPMQGRKVVFKENVSDPVNADGKQGHLEAVANTTHIPTFYEKYVKRGFDIVLSFGGLVVLSPIYAVTALAIKADDPGPVLFKQKRVGEDKSYFELLKFRSMSVNTPKDVPTHMLQNGGITKVGAFIRKASIDELPQLWNIFRGNMSVIGPRPALWNQDYLTAERDKYGANDVKPGLTGLAQISGRDELEIEKKAKLDGVYANALRKSSLSGMIIDSKLFLGSLFSVLISNGESYVASDVPAILKYTRSVYYIGNMEIAKLEKGNVTFYNIDSEVIEKPLTEIKWDAESAEKGGYEHFMLKEIHEQPKVVRDTINSVVNNGIVHFDSFNLTDEEIKDIDIVYIVACGSAYHVGMDLQYVIESLTTLSVRVELASEFRYREMTLRKNSLVIVISQSGETADTLAALRMAKDQGIKTLGIVNVVGSSIARESDSVFYTLAGPEISVATTKAYSCQLVAGYLLSLQFAKSRSEITDKKYMELLNAINTIPDKIERILADKERLQWYSNKLINITDSFFIGRGIDYAIGMEGSLKLKEISYIHSEAYAAGELKHGPISLIEDGTIVISVVTQDRLGEKTISNMVEVKSRGAKVMAVTTAGNYNLEDTAEFVCYVPAIENLFAGSLSVIPLQLMSYYVSVGKGFDVDKPRNLAKSVTVE